MYEFKCKECNHNWQVMCKMSERDNVKECPQCNSENIKRLISSGTTFILKGSGWASDNYS